MVFTLLSATGTIISIMHIMYVSRSWTRGWRLGILQSVLYHTTAPAPFLALFKSKLGSLCLSKRIFLTNEIVSVGFYFNWKPSFIIFSYFFQNTVSLLFYKYFKIFLSSDPLFFRSLWYFFTGTINTLRYFQWNHYC